MGPVWNKTPLKNLPKAAAETRCTQRNLYLIDYFPPTLVKWLFRSYIGMKRFRDTSEERKPCSKPKRLPLQTLLRKQCRCKAKECLTQFSGCEDAIQAARDELNGLEPAMRDIQIALVLNLGLPELQQATAESVDAFSDNSSTDDGFLDESAGEQVNDDSHFSDETEGSVIFHWVGRVLRRNRQVTGSRERLKVSNFRPSDAAGPLYTCRRWRMTLSPIKDDRQTERRPRRRRLKRQAFLVRLRMPAPSGGNPSANGLFRRFTAWATPLSTLCGMADAVRDQAIAGNQNTKT